MGRSKAPSALTIAALTTAIVSAVVGVGGYPLAKQAWSDHEAQKIRMFYATGLSPCAAPVARFMDEIDQHLRPYLPADPNLSITVFPSFSEPHGVRIVGDTLIYFRLLPPNDARREPHTEDWFRLDTLRKKSLTRPVAQSIQETLANDIAHAVSEIPQGLDGETYFFRTADRRCAMTWSPNQKTRAGMWRSLFYALSEWSRPGAKPEDEAEVRRWTEALQEN